MYRDTNSCYKLVLSRDFHDLIKFMDGVNIETYQLIKLINFFFLCVPAL